MPKKILQRIGGRRFYSLSHEADADLADYLVRKSLGRLDLNMDRVMHIAPEPQAHLRTTYRSFGGNVYKFGDDMQPEVLVADYRSTIDGRHTYFLQPFENGSIRYQTYTGLNPLLMEIAKRLGPAREYMRQEQRALDEFNRVSQHPLGAKLVSVSSLQKGLPGQDYIEKTASSSFIDASKVLAAEIDAEKRIAELKGKSSKARHANKLPGYNTLFNDGLTNTSRFASPDYERFSKALAAEIDAEKRIAELKGKSSKARHANKLPGYNTLFNDGLTNTSRFASPDYERFSKALAAEIDAEKVVNTKFAEAKKYNIAHDSNVNTYTDYQKTLAFNRLAEKVKARDEGFNVFVRRSPEEELTVNSNPAELIKTVNKMKAQLKRRFQSKTHAAQATPSKDPFLGILQRGDI